jgi:site-specific recombinase XerD
MAIQTLPQVVSFPKSACSDDSPVRSYAESNRKLLEGFSNFLLARGMSPRTIRAYDDSARRLVESLGSKSVLDANRSDIRKMQSRLLSKGLCANSVRLHTAALRSFFDFVRLSGLTKHDPTLTLSQRKIPFRLGRVLPIEEVDSLVSACRIPLETAVVETLYATGVRVAEFVQLRLEDIDFGNPVNGEPGRIRVKNGKGRKDRNVYFGPKADAAIQEYLKARKCEEFLFQPPNAQRPYSVEAIRVILKRVAFRAKVADVHPHALRRSMASHMLAGGADLRSIQELLGHARLSTTMRYLSVSASNLKEVYDKCHPHANVVDHAEKE